MADIAAGKLTFVASAGTTSINYLNYSWTDSGAIKNDACYDGSVTSPYTYVQIASPVAIDLNGDGHIGVTGATSSQEKDANAPIGHTVLFDMHGDGKPVMTEWFDGSGDGILVDNRDGHAATDMNGNRLFGDVDGHGNGYCKLQALDANGDGTASSAATSSRASRSGWTTATPSSRAAR